MKIQIKGLRKIAGESKSLKGYYSPEYLQLNYDRKTEEAWTDFHYSLGHNSWVRYDDKNIIIICNICRPVTMKEVREMIEGKLEEIDDWEKYLESC